MKTRNYALLVLGFAAAISYGLVLLHSALSQAVAS